MKEGLTVWIRASPSTYDPRNECDPSILCARLAQLAFFAQRPGE